MDADFSVELGSDDPVLDLPWTDPSGRLAYVDMKRHPELLPQIEEAKQYPELADLLRAVNSPRSSVESAKCDAWRTEELTPDELILGVSHKFASYVDVVFSDAEDRRSFPRHEQFAKRLVALLRRAPDIGSSAEVCVRRLFFREGSERRDGFYCTVYVNGYASDETSARKQWGIGLKLVENAMVQGSRTEA